ncbi:hypothetical protein GW17_00002360 [Ensete ventricosum]|nr:hypothetical protein GW17_00002360 [Ensete ventricosum]
MLVALDLTATLLCKMEACHNPNTVLSHWSCGANSLHQRNGQAQTARDFSATAMLTSTDPYVNGSVYPATPSTAGTSSTPTSTSLTSRATPNTFSSTKVNTTIRNSLSYHPLVRRRLFSRLMGGMNPSGRTSSRGWQQRRLASNGSSSLSSIPFT